MSAWAMRPGERGLFTDLPADRFPFTVILLDAESGDGVWRTVVTGPGVIEVPGRNQINGGRPVRVRVEWPDGTSSEADAP